MSGRETRLVYVTGTGTDVGKTVVTAALLAALKRSGRTVQAIKPIQTGIPVGSDGPGGDAAVYADAVPDARVATLVVFPDPCSPHLAAEREGASLTVADLASGVRARLPDAEYTLVEGAGGFLVPLNRTETTADLAAALQAELVLVVGNALGALNHALLTLEAARSRGLRLAAVVMTSPVPPSTDPLVQALRHDNAVILGDREDVPLLVHLPHLPLLADSEAAVRAGAWREAAEHLVPVAKALIADGTRHETGGQAVAAFDREHLWHPYAPTTPPPQTWIVRSTHGTRLILDDGRELVDGMSSWWAAVHGYNHPAILEAVRRQAARMPHVMFGGLTHRPAAALGEKLLALAPGEMNRVFYCDSGSVAVEAALKMALQYQQARGNGKKRRIATPLGGYHGDTQGAMSVCDPVNGMHSLFRGVLAQQVFFDRPACPFGSDFNQGTLAGMDKAFSRHGDELAALILEPIVQGAGGMWMYHPEYLRHARRLCDQYDVLLICDEIATGFGRTGRMFASEWAETAPDILCLGKALTGGWVTLAAVLAREAIAHTISSHGVFMHGPTFMANPLACAAALASLEVLEASGWQERVQYIERQLRDGLEPCRDQPGITDVRVLGAIGVLETDHPVNADRLQRYFVDRHGVWIRPFSRLIYVMPPYVSTRADITRLVEAITGAAKEEQWR